MPTKELNFLKFFFCRVKHLILADPWGFAERPKELAAPLWVRAIAKVYGNVNPLWILRAGRLINIRFQNSLFQKFPFFSV